MKKRGNMEKLTKKSSKIEYPFSVWVSTSFKELLKTRFVASFIFFSAKKDTKELKC